MDPKDISYNKTNKIRTFLLLEASNDMNKSFTASSTKINSTNPLSLLKSNNDLIIHLPEERYSNSKIFNFPEVKSKIESNIHSSHNKLNLSKFSDEKISSESIFQSSTDLSSLSKNSTIY